MAMVTTQAMALATTLRVTKWAMARATRAIVTNTVATVTVVLAPLSQQHSSLLLPLPQLPNAVALIASIAAAVAITHLFDTAMKRQWHGQWQRK
jgi:hypothetical protein